MLTYVLNELTNSTQDYDKIISVCSEGLLQCEFFVSKRNDNRAQVNLTNKLLI